jgi:hypothetical protein
MLVSAMPMLNVGVGPMIDFDEATHTYRVEGEVLPSVTQIMQSTGLVRPYTGDPWYGQRGTACHYATTLIDAGTLDPESVDPVISGFLDAYARFKRETGMEWEYSEYRLAHPLYRFCGCVDRAVPLVDLKTTDSACELQLAGYQALLLANGIDPGREGYFLHLKENGTYKLRTYKFNRQDTNIWLSAVSLYHWRKEHNLL